ncbi:MAG: carboxypeptidase-like regulatory domain-containing protein [Luteimonas sp.]
MFNRKNIKQGFFGLTAALGLTLTAHAQSSVGHITGKAVAGDTIIVDGTSGGFHREITLKKDGKYQFRSVSPGQYEVTVKHADGTTDPTKAVLVKVGSTARVQ